jgi:predicted dehydrogenase
MTRIGIIGLGFMGRMHYETYQKIPDAQVVMVADKDPKRAAGDLSGGWGNMETGIQQLPMDRIRGVTEWRMLVADPNVDVVDICVATPLHVELTLAALAAGKHVLCEKPLALTSAQAREVSAAAARAKGFFMPAMCLRFWAEWEWMKRAVAEQHYGRVRAATFRRVGSMPAGWFKDGKSSGGALLDLHIHDTDFVQHLFGKPHGVFSRGYSKTSGEIDHLVTHYLYDGNLLVCAEGSWCLADGWPFNMSFTVNCEHATIDFDLSRKETPLIVYADGKVNVIETDKHDGFFGELSYFVECVRTNTRPQRVTADDAVADLILLEAEKKSVQSGQVVMLGE